MNQRRPQAPLLHTDDLAAIHPRQLLLPSAATITQVSHDNYRTKTVVLDLALDAYPGQFVMLWLPRFDEKPYSLVDSDPVTVMVTAVGPFSQLMHTLQPGDRVWVRGPFGHGFHVPGDHRRLALVGGGYGVAPLLWLARTQAGRAASITTIIGARTAADLLYVGRFTDLASAASSRPPTATRFELAITTEDGSQGGRGRVVDALRPLLEAGKIDDICACGPHGMLAALEALGEEYSIACQLSWEAYMRCGIGICGACEHGGRLLCLDGPVLTTAEATTRKA